MTVAGSGGQKRTLVKSSPVVPLKKQKLCIYLFYKITFILLVASWVWNHFNLVQEDSENKENAICKHCSDKMAKNTSTMAKHLRRWHKNEIPDQDIHEIPDQDIYSLPRPHGWGYSSWGPELQEMSRLACLVCLVSD